LTAPDRILDEVAAAVADGNDIDWPEVHRRLEGTENAKAASALESVEAFGRESRSTSLRTQAQGPLHPILYLMIPAVVLQVLLGVAGFLFGPGSSVSVPGWPLAATAIVMAASGVVVAIAGRWDPRTSPLAGVFLSIASAPAITLTSFMAAGATQRLASAPLFEVFLPFFLWWFVEQFPRVLRLERRGRWFAWAKYLSLSAGLVLFVVNGLDRLIPGHSVFDSMIPILLRSGTAHWSVVLLLALPAPFVIFLRLRHTEGSERRRVLLFMWGLALGVVPIVVMSLLDTLSPSFSRWVSSPRKVAVTVAIAYGFLLTIPVSLGYAAVARRALDLRFFLDRAARIVLARGLVWTFAIVPWMTVVVVFWAERQQPLTDLFQRPLVPVLVIAGLLGIALLLGRDRLLMDVERRLTSSRLASGAELASLGNRLGTVRDIDELSLTVREEGARLLRASSCDLLLRRDGDDSWYEAVGGTCGRLDARSAIIGLVEASPEPISVDVGDADSWFRLLPEEDRMWSAEADFRLLVPVTEPGGECVALMAFGPSVTGRVFTRPDLDIAAAAASTISLSLAPLSAELHPGSVPRDRRMDSPAGECRSCGRVMEICGSTCMCGEVTKPAAIPYLLSGKFRLGGILGSGGMGVVYLGRDVTLDRTVALKTLPRMRSGSLMRLRREARSMASFVHPNLALIFGVETWRGVPVLIVEYLRGGTLLQTIGKVDDPVFVTELGIRIAGALAALHDKGILHRDVKPANIGFSEEKEPKLLDFGLAQVIEQSRDDLVDEMVTDVDFETEGLMGGRLTQTAHVVGTPLYLSPEVLKGREPTPEQDIWALHVVMWEALVGKHPLAGLSTESALEKVRSGSIPSVREGRSDCPEVLVNLLDRGLNRRRSVRPKSARRLARDLQAAVQELS